MKVISFICFGFIDFVVVCLFSPAGCAMHNCSESKAASDAQWNLWLGACRLCESLCMSIYYKINRTTHPI